MRGKKTVIFGKDLIFDGQELQKGILEVLLLLGKTGIKTCFCQGDGSLTEVNISEKRQKETYRAEFIQGVETSGDVFVVKREAKNNYFQVKTPTSVINAPTLDDVVKFIIQSAEKVT